MLSKLMTWITATECRTIAATTICAGISGGLAGYTIHRILS
jgi:hypothetical protein